MRICYGCKSEIKERAAFYYEGISNTGVLCLTCFTKLTITTKPKITPSSPVHRVSAHYEAPPLNPGGYREIIGQRNAAQERRAGAATGRTHLHSDRGMDAGQLGPRALQMINLPTTGPKRTPPPLQPNGWEKSSERIEVACTPTEKLVWQAVYGRRKMAETIRKMLNKHAYKKAGIAITKTVPG